MKKLDLGQLLGAASAPSNERVTQSRRRVQEWFAQSAPLIQWDVVESPLGQIYVAAGVQGVCRVEFGVDETTFLSELDRLARTEWNGTALAHAREQLREYFAGTRYRFDLPLDLSRLTSFQRSVLQITRGIAAGTLWTYGQVATALGKPKASRPVGQALGRNPLPIVIPCHRVVASDGSLGGYSGGGGLDSKRFLLRLEGAL